ncbi:MAG: transposase [Stigonema ocellatum SAG 48.90 = DSM 106950]|nr:transposase [Stigonema ocellatum SAG 48.90 = DSM 106950]
MIDKSNDDQKLLNTIWCVPDDLWNKLKPIFEQYDPPKPIGRKRIDTRAALNAIIFRLRSGCQWNQLPDQFPDDSSVHRTFQQAGSHTGANGKMSWIN